MSYKKQEWKIGPVFETKTAFLEGIMKQRQSEAKSSIESFLRPQLSDLYDEGQMHGMKALVQRIKLAIEKKERIIVFGDFDSDGITSTALFVSALTKMGASVSYRIPDREKDSHGLKKHHIEDLLPLKVGLLITCDCGVNDKESVAYAVENNIDVIITDHHDPDMDQFPTKAIAVVNPHLPMCPYLYKHLAGVGVAFKCIVGVAQEVVPAEELASFLEPFLELVALGTVADCMPLTDENRTLVHYGLQAMKQTSWPGLAMLFDRAGVDISMLNEDTIRFVIAPRLNAASRMGDVMHSLQLFLGDTSGHKERLEYLDSMNKQRQELTHAAIEKALPQVQNAPILFVFDANWRPGILGLIAGKLVERYRVPVVAMGEYDGSVHASCRSPQGVSIIEGLRSCDELFMYYGGHDGAAGFRIKHEHRSELEDRLQSYYSSIDRVEIPLDVAGVLPVQMLDLEMVQVLNTLRPFGEGNPMPRFCLERVCVEDWKLMGKESNHIRLMGIHASKPITLVGFFMGDMTEMLEKNSQYDVVVELDESTWQGNHRLDLRIVDIRVMD